MNKIKDYLKSVLILTILVIIGVFSFVDARVAETGDNTSSISGYINPIVEGTTVVIKELGATEPSGSDIISSDGSYEIAGLKSGIYNLFVSVEGFYDYKHEMIGIDVNKKLIGYNITLVPITETDNNSSSISGCVEPIVEGATVIIKEYGATNPSGSSVISSDGCYEITSLRRGTYGLFVTTQDFHGYKWGMIEIPANTRLSGYDIRLTPRTKEYLIDRITVEFNNDVNKEEIISIIKSYNCTIMEYNSLIHNYEIGIPNDRIVDELIELFKTNSKVSNAYKHGISFASMYSSPGEMVGAKTDDDILKRYKSRKNITLLNNVSLQDTIKENLTEKDNTINEKENKSLFSKIIQFFKSLFRLR